MVGAVITAAGANSRMREDLKLLNLPLNNKLTLPLINNEEYRRTVLECTISNVLNSGIKEVILVLGHYKEEIVNSLNDYYLSRIKIVENDPADVGLSTSLYNGLSNIDDEYVLCVSGDQPTISYLTYENMLRAFFNSQNPNNSITFLRRREYGKLDSAVGLGMPFILNKNLILPYIKNVNDNLNPILRDMLQDGIEFYAVKELFDLELVNVNHYEDFKFVCKKLNPEYYKFNEDYDNNHTVH